MAGPHGFVAVGIFVVGKKTGFIRQNLPPLSARDPQIVSSELLVRACRFQSVSQSVMCIYMGTHQLFPTLVLVYSQPFNIPLYRRLLRL